MDRTNTKKFQRYFEDFTCNHCGYFVVGNGYTNHCPQCLWSQHVDINPGDRAASCLGMMQPISVTKRGRNYDIEFVCLICGKKHKNKCSESDDFGVMVKVGKQ